MGYVEKQELELKWRVNKETGNGDLKQEWKRCWET